MTHPGITSRRIAGVDIARNQPVRRRVLVGAASLLISAALAGCNAAESSATALIPTIHQGMNATIVVVADPTSTEGVQK